MKRTSSFNPKTFYGPACVYDIRHGDDVLYVGCSRNPKARLTAHHKRRWFKKGAIVVVVQWLDSRNAALSAEAKRIHALKPVGNVAFTEPLPPHSLHPDDAKKVWFSRNRKYRRLSDYDVVSDMPGWTIGLARNLLGDRSFLRELVD